MREGNDMSRRVDRPCRAAFRRAPGPAKQVAVTQDLNRFRRGRCALRTLRSMVPNPHAQLALAMLRITSEKWFIQEVRRFARGGRASGKPYAVTCCGPISESSFSAKHSLVDVDRERRRAVRG